MIARPADALHLVVLGGCEAQLDQRSVDGELVPDHDDSASAYRPFALDAEELWPEIEDEIVGRGIQGSRDADAALYALVNYRRFGDKSFLICCQH